MNRESENFPLRGAFIIMAAAAYAFMGAPVKSGRAIPDQQGVFARHFICLITLLPSILLPKPHSLRTTVVPTYVIRAVAGLLNMSCFFTRCATSCSPMRYSKRRRV